MKLSLIITIGLVASCTLLTAAQSLAAATTTMGSTDARRCFDESRLPLSEQGIVYCDRAINAKQLTRRDLAATYSNRGIIYANNGKYQAAIKDHDHAIELTPTLAEAYINRGNVYYHTHDYDRALADYSQAADLGASPSHVPYYNRALTLIKMKRKDEARASLEQALERSPDSKKIKKQMAALETL